MTRDNRLSRRAVLARLGAASALAVTSSKARAEIRGKVVIGKDGWLFGAWEDVRHVDLQRLRPLAPLFSRAVQLFRTAGIELVVTVAPTRARIYQDMLPADFQPNHDAVQRYPHMLELLRGTGALVPDFATALAQARASQPEPVFLKTDTHWTGAGSEAAAAELAKIMLAKYRLPPTTKHGPKLGAYQTFQNPGEIRRMMLPEDQKAYPATEPLKIRKTEFRFASPQGILIEDDSSDIIIVGNSYMLPQYGFPDALANRLDRPVSLAVKAQNIGPYRTLLDYLASSQFKGHVRPKVLIWHHLEGSIDQTPDVRSWWGEGTMQTSAFLSDLQRLLVV
jgi:alginate O-acetyltransferase complex protein AlgJ